MKKFLLSIVLLLLIHCPVYASSGNLASLTSEHTEPYAEKAGAPVRAAQVDDNITMSEIKEENTGSYEVRCNMSYSRVTGNADAVNLPVGLAECAAGENVYFNLQVGTNVYIKSATLYIYKNGSLYTSDRAPVNASYIRYASIGPYNLPSGNYTYSWKFTYSNDSPSGSNASFEIGNGFSIPQISASSSSITLDVYNKKSSTVDLTFSYLSSTAFQVAYDIGNSNVLSASWGTQNGAVKPITLTAKSPGTTTVICEVVRKSDRSEVARKTLNVTVKDSTPTYTIYLNGNGGSVTPTSFQIKKGEKYTKLSTAVVQRTGYEFIEWHTDHKTVITANSVANVTANQHLWAYWKPKNYTVTFNANGGTVSKSSQTVTYDSTYGTLPTPERKEYVFDGWYTSSSGGTRITDQTTVKITSNQTLYAHWTPKQYTVYFDGNGGTCRTSSKAVAYGNTYGTLPSSSQITRTGYEFMGWYTSASGGTRITENTKVTITSNQTLYAHWEVKKIQVTYNANGGNGTTTKAISYGNNYTLPANPTRTGYTFKGWFTSSSGGTQVTGATRMTATTNHTLYARWEAVKYTVTYDANGGYGTTSKIIAYESNYILPSTPGRDGYEFRGWWTSTYGGTQITSSTKMNTASNHTLYAHWEAKQIRVNLSYNGQTTYRTVTYDGVYGDVVSFIPSAPTGYHFKGWFTSYAGGSQVSSSTRVSTAYEHTLYAQWEGNQYSVTFDSNGGASVANKNVIFGSPYGELPVPQKSGYGFAGWFNGAGQQIYSTTTVNEANSHILYAHWNKKFCTVKFNANGGKISISSIPYGMGNKYGTLPYAQRSGCIFVGWYTTKAAGTKVTENSTVPTKESLTLYARWKLKAPGGLKVTSKPELTSKVQWKNTIKWSKVSGAASYTIEKRMENGSWKTLKTVTGNSYTETSEKFAVGMTYYYRVRANAKKNVGVLNSGNSSAKSVQIQPYFKRTKYADEQAVAIGWGKYHNAKKVQIELKKYTGGYWKTITIDGKAVKTFEGKMLKIKMYYLKVGKLKKGTYKIDFHVTYSNTSKDVKSFNFTL